MSRFDTTVASMAYGHALFGVKVRIILASITFQRDRMMVLQEHRRIIERRMASLGEGVRLRRKAVPEPERMLA